MRALPYPVSVPFDGAFSPLHWLIIAVVALLVLGPDQLPKLARRAGRAMTEVQRVRTHLASELRDVVSEFDAAPSASLAINSLPSQDGISQNTTEENTHDASAG